MTKIKTWTIEAIGLGWLIGTAGFVGIGFGFDGAGGVLFLLGCLLMGIGLAGVFLLGLAQLMVAD